MNVLIVYESQYGNTKEVAMAIAGAVKKPHKVLAVAADLVEPAEVKAADLLIVGSPTHGGVTAPAVHDFLKNLKTGSLRGVKVAGFDTRVSMKLVKLFGFAAGHIDRELQRAGGSLAAPPEGFYVHGKQGPLKPGEEARAAKWAAGIIEEQSWLTQEEPTGRLRSPQQ